MQSVRLLVVRFADVVLQTNDPQHQGAAHHVPVRLTAVDNDSAVLMQLDPPEFTVGVVAGEYTERTLTVWNQGHCELQMQSLRVPADCSCISMSRVSNEAREAARRER